MYFHLIRYIHVTTYINVSILFRISYCDLITPLTVCKNNATDHDSQSPSQLQAKLLWSNSSNHIFNINHGYEFGRLKPRLAAQLCISTVTFPFSATTCNLGDDR